VQAIASSGSFIANRAAQWQPVNNRWENIRSLEKNQPVECRSDAGIHGENAGDDEVYAYNSGRRTFADDVAADQLDWESSPETSTGPTLYSANYLNWYFNPTLVDRTRSRWCRTWRPIS
jgi:hypothetical protein